MSSRIIQIFLRRIFNSLIDDILKGSKFLNKTTTGLKIFEKDGTFEQALGDFNKLCPSKVIKNQKDIKVGILDDGRRVIIRKFSKDGRITLEIQRKTGKKMKSEIKIIYTNKPILESGEIEPLFGLFF